MAQVRLCLSQLGFPWAPCSHVEAVWSSGNNVWGRSTLPKWAFLHLSFLCYNSGDGSGKRRTAAGKENSAEAVCGEWSVLHLGFS